MKMASQSYFQNPKMDTAETWKATVHYVAAILYSVDSISRLKKIILIK